MGALAAQAGETRLGLSLRAACTGQHVNGGVGLPLDPQLRSVVWVGPADRAARGHPCQVLRDFEPLETTEGANRLTEESFGKYQDRVQQFLHELAPRSDQKPLPGLRDDGMPNLQHLVALDHTLFVTTSLNMKSFQADRPLRPLGPTQERYFVETSSLSPAVAASSLGRARRSCIIDKETGATALGALWVPGRLVLQEVIDMGPCSWPVRSAMFCGFDIRGSYTFDVHHRRWDDCILSMTNSGLTLLRLECALVYTFTAGPWHSDGWFGSLASAARQWNESSDHRDALFQVMYPHIVRDQCGGKLPSSFGSDEHQRQVCAALPDSLVFAKRGLQMKMNRWYQLIRNTESFAPHWSSCLAATIVIGIFKGRFTGIGEFPFLVGPQFGDAAEVAAVVGDPAAAPRAASSAPSEGPAGAGPWRSVRFSNEHINRLRSFFANEMHLAARVLSMFETRSVMVGVARLTRPLMEEHALTTTTMKTQMGCKNWRTEMAVAGRASLLQDIFDTLGGRDLLLQIGLLDCREFNKRCLFSSPEAQRVATTMVTYCCNLLLHEVLFMMAFSSDFPLVFAGFLHHDADKRKEVADFCRDAFAAVTLAEARSHQDVWMGEFVKDLCWPGQTWARQVLISLQEAAPDADAPSADILQDIEEASRGPCSTKGCEDGFNVLRSATKATRNGALSRQGRWQHCISSPIVAEKDYIMPEATAQDEIDAVAANHGRMNKSVFEAKSVQFSLGNDVIKAYLRGPRHWPSISTRSFMRTSIALNSLIACKEAPDKLKTAFASKLFLQGQVAGRCEVRGSAKVLQLWWVLGSFQYGFLGIPMVSKRHKNLKFLVPQWEDGRSWESIVVADDWCRWKSISVTATPPTIARAKYGIDIDDPPELLGIILEFLEIMPVQVAAAKWGFCNMTVEDMKNFVSLAGAPYERRRPSTAAGLCTLLIRWAIPEATDEQVSAYLACRENRSNCPHETVLSESNVSSVEAFLQSDEAHETTETLKRHSRARRGLRSQRAAETARRPLRASRRRIPLSRSRACQGGFGIN